MAMRIEGWIRDRDTGEGVSEGEILFQNADYSGGSYLYGGGNYRTDWTPVGACVVTITAPGYPPIRMNMPASGDSLLIINIEINKKGQAFVQSQWLPPDSGPPSDPVGGFVLPDQEPSWPEPTPEEELPEPGGLPGPDTPDEPEAPSGTQGTHGTSCPHGLVGTEGTS